MQNKVTDVNASMEVDTYHFTYDDEYKLLEDQESNVDSYYRISFIYNKNTGGFTVRAIRLNPFDSAQVQELYLMDEEIVIGVKEQ